MVFWSELNNKLRQGLSDIDGGWPTSEVDTWVQLKSLGLVADEKREDGAVNEFLTPEGKELLDENYCDPELEAEGLTELFDDYHKAQREYSKIFDNPPPADEQGRWPGGYVRDLEDAEKACNFRLQLLGLWALRNEAELNPGFKLKI